MPRRYVQLILIELAPPDIEELLAETERREATTCPFHRHTTLEAGVCPMCALEDSLMAIHQPSIVPPRMAREQ